MTELYKPNTAEFIPNESFRVLLDYFAGLEFASVQDVLRQSTSPNSFIMKIYLVPSGEIKKALAVVTGLDEGEIIETIKNEIRELKSADSEITNGEIAQLAPALSNLVAVLNQK